MIVYVNMILFFYFIFILFFFLIIYYIIMTSLLNFRQDIQSNKIQCDDITCQNITLSNNKNIDTSGTVLNIGVNTATTINLGNANSQDVCKLINKMQEAAFEKYNILLKPEIKPLGVFNESEATIWTNAA